jgi:sulfate adenylyltransferase
MKNKGMLILFTGLSGSGKTTVGRALYNELQKKYGLKRDITLLDGDEVRAMLSGEQDYSIKARETNLLRIAYVSSLLVKAGSIVIATPIAPFSRSRKKMRDMVEHYGDFIEIYISTALEVAEKRDVKGLYKKARAKQIINFTGIDSPYEVPQNANIELDTSKISVKDSVQKIILYLQNYM